MSTDEPATAEPPLEEQTPPAPPAEEGASTSRSDRNASRKATTGRRRLLFLGVALLVVVGAVLFAAVKGAQDDRIPRIRRNVAAYSGLGAWIDVHDERFFADPEGTVQSLAAHGVRTLYVETSNYDRPYDIYQPEAQAKLIEAAHAVGMDVVAWYLPGFLDPGKDVNRSLAAIRFRTPGGQQFDGFGLDIESAEVKPVPKRVKIMLRESAKLRAAVGADYALGAIIPSPVGMLSSTSYWGAFPYLDVAKDYDIFLPMTYSSYRAKGEQQTHDYISQAIEIIRTETGDPEVPVHVIGGIANGMSARETRGFVHAARENGVMGASVYDFSTTGADAWPELVKAPFNPVQFPGLPVDIDYSDPLGNFTGGDRTHPKEVFFSLNVAGLSTAPKGQLTLSFEATGAQADEVSVWVNWHQIGTVAPAGPGKTWGQAQQISVPAHLLHEGDNFIQFEAPGNWPDWSTWGVRNVSLGP